MCELVAEEGLSLDVATGGELAAARRAGFPPARIYFHGNNKSVAEIEVGLDVGIGRFVVDSFEEIDPARGGGRRRAGCASRCSCASRPACGPTPTSFVQTGQQDSKFGFGLADGRRARGGAPRRDAPAPRARRRARAHRLADLRARLVPARGRGAVRRHRRVAPRARLRVPRLQHRRRPRHPLHAEPTSRAPSPSSPRRPWTRPSARSERHGMAMPQLFVEPGAASPARRR